MDIDKAKHKKRRVHAIFSYFSGFSLIEVVVSIAILATITTGLMIGINPRAQQEKAQDAVRVSDISEVRKALNIYYSDTKCFPVTSSPFATALENGASWKEGNTVYMQKVPKDPSGSAYTYIVDTTSTCPQWGTIFAKLSKQQAVTSQGTTAFCPLASSGSASCVPLGFDSSWACVTSGNTNCALLTSGSLLTPTPTPTVTFTPTPTPTPTPQNGDFTVALNANPQFYQGTLAPMYPTQGSTAQILIKVADPSPVTSVTATVFTDTKTNNVTFALTSGTVNDGTWTGNWIVNDTLENFYKISFFGTDAANNHSTVDVVLR